MNTWVQIHPPRNMGESMHMQHPPRTDQRLSMCAAATTTSSTMKLGVQTSSGRVVYVYVNVCVCMCVWLISLGAHEFK